VATQPIARVTPEEYLRFDREAETKHEYFDGEIVAMAGGPPRHALITMNAGAALWSQLTGSGCRVFSPDLRVCVRYERLFAYPDVVVVRGEPEYVDERRDTVTNPTMLIEVLSPSTSNYDLGAKGFLYRSLPSLREYLLVEPDTTVIEHYRRTSGGDWQITTITDPAAIIHLESVK
jgi:Uma2 family endonuclease